jgi:putative membrane protein
MKLFLLLGKLATLGFWGIVISNLLQPLAQPFDVILQLAGAVFLVLHAVEILIFHKRLAASRWPFLQRAQVLLFGVFHVWGLPESKVEAVAASVVEVANPEQVKEG